MRICIVGALTVGIALTIAAGASFAAGHVVGQTSGYDSAPQVLGEQFIKSKNASSGFGLWIGLLVALVILALAAFFGWRRTHEGTETA